MMNVEIARRSSSDVVGRLRSIAPRISCCVAVGSLALLLMLASLSAWQGATLPSVLPVDSIAGIVDALKTHEVVALSAGDSHDDERGPAFVLALIRDRRFALAVNDILTEGTSARYQDVMDRYVRGEQVSDEAIRKVWDDTTQPQVPGPIWTGEVPPLNRAVREVNASLLPERQMRILLGDPPIDWERVHTAADYRTWLEQRDSFPAELIQREVLAKGRRVLVVFGGGHLQRKNQVANYQMDHPLAQTIVSLLEKAGTRVFVLRTLTDQEATPSWPVPSLALVRGTT